MKGSSSSSALGQGASVRPQRDGERRARTLVTEPLRAFHTDPIMDEGRHEHVWHVTAVFDGASFRDARSLKGSLRTILDAWEGKDLPAELWSAEALAAAVLQLHGNADCIGVKINRSEGFGAEVWL